MYIIYPSRYILEPCTQYFYLKITLKRLGPSIADIDLCYPLFQNIIYKVNIICNMYIKKYNRIQKIKTA